MPTREILTFATAPPDPNPSEPEPSEPDPSEPGPNEPYEPAPIQYRGAHQTWMPIGPPLSDGTPEEFPFTEPKHYPIHPDIPTQPIHEPMPERPERTIA